MPTPTTATLPTFGSTSKDWKPSSPCFSCSTSWTLAAAVPGTVKEMSAVPVEAEACTIMSTFTPASASMVNTFAAMPGSFGTRRTVASDSVLSCATPEMIGTSGPRSGNRSPMDWLLFSLMFLPLFVKSYFRFRVVLQVFAIACDYAARLPFRCSAGCADRRLPARSACRDGGRRSCAHATACRIVARIPRNAMPAPWNRRTTFPASIRSR